MITLVSKYDVILNEHLKYVLNKTEQMYLKGSKSRGNFLTLLGHYSINNVLMIL